MKVYVVTEEWNVNCEPGLNVSVFKDKNKAIATYDELVVSAKIDGESFNFKEVIDEENHFEIYEEGYYSMNHICINLFEKEIGEDE